MTSRLIFINRYYRPDHSATSQLLTDLAEALANSGVDVTIITSRQLYEHPRICLPKRELLDGVSVRRVWTSRFGRRTNIGRVFDYLSFLISAAIYVWRLAGSRVVIVAKTDPPFLGFVAAVVGGWRGARTINWVQDLFPDVAFAAGVRVPNALRPLMTGLRDTALRRASVNVAIGSLMAKKIRTYAPLSGVEVIHNWVPFSYVKPIARDENDLRTAWGMRDKFVVGYSGNMGRAHEFDTILGAADKLKADTSVTFLLIGGGVHRNAIEGEVHARDLSNVVLKPYQSAEQLAYSLSAPDVHIVSLRPELEGCIVPSKFYGALSAGRPVIFIGQPDGEISRLLAKHACGFTVEQEDQEGLVAAIDALRKSPDRLSRMSQNAAKASELYGRNRALQKWRMLILAAAAT